MTTDKLTITAKNALAAFTDAVVFASDDTLRPALYAVKVSANAGRCQLVGCDSYVLGTFTFAGEGTMTALIAVDDVKRIIALAKAELKVHRAGETDLVLERTDDCLEVRGHDATISCRLVYGDYPNWRHLFGKAELEGRAVLTAHVLGKLAKVSCGFKASKARADRPGMRIEMHGLKPAHLELEHDGIVFVGLAMPAKAVDARAISDPELVEAPVETETRLELEARLRQLEADMVDDTDDETHFPNGTVDHAGTVAS